MTRLLLVLVCVLFAFVILTNVAPDLVPDFLKGHVVPHPADTSSAKEVAKSKPGAPLKRIVERKVPTEPSETAAAAPETLPAVPAPARSAARPVFSVSAESADLYVTNSTSSPAVSVLTNGEVVEPQYIMNTAGQEWTYVKVADKKISGFVRSEDLSRK